jgi:G3E family GTPase
MEVMVTLTTPISIDHPMTPTQTDTRVPVTLLTGFLGSGKTTLLNRILSENHGKRIAVIENEFGEVGVDNELVIGAEEEIFEMNNGCICCTVRGDLIRILGNLLKRRDRFDAILIETTGMADPGPVAQTFFVDPDMQQKVRLDGIITLVDTKHIGEHLGTSREAQEQIAFADVIVLNKIDLVSAEDVDNLRMRLHRINPSARLLTAQMAAIDLKLVLNVGAFELKRALEIDPRFLEPEYPFEWVGLYRLAGGKASMSAHPGPDSTMDALLLPLSGESEADLNAALERAVLLFSDDSESLVSGGNLRAGEKLWSLQMPSEPGEKAVFSCSTSESGVYALFTQHGPEEFQLVLDRGGVPLKPIRERVFKPDHAHEDAVTSVGIDCEGELDLARFNAWLSGLLQQSGADIYRSKGVVALRGESKRYVFQGVHMLLDGGIDRPWGDQPRRNRLVFIGRRLDRQALVNGFKACLAT